MADVANMAAFKTAADIRGGLAVVREQLALGLLLLISP
jgi:hypothetical protein